MLTKVGDLLGAADVVQDLVDRATQLSQLYDDFVEADPGDGHLRAPGIHASEIGMCERRVVYSIRNMEKRGSLKKNWRQRFQFGKQIHSLIQADFHALARKSQGLIRFEDEVPVSPKYQAIARELNIHSHCDGVFTFYDDPLGPAVLRVGLEIKTESPDEYKKLEEPKEQHVEQAHIYMKCLDLPLMYFMYVNKGNQNNTPSIEPYLVRFNPNIWDRLEAKCRRLLKVAKGVELPERTESILCDFCPYAWTCEPNFKKSSAPVSSAKWKSLSRRA